jgi:hypothetical protein
MSDEAVHIGHDVWLHRNARLEMGTRDSTRQRLTAKGKPRKRNPAPGESVVLRLQPYELDLLDGWMIEQDDIPETRQDAIRRLIALVCGKMKEK